MNKLDSAKARQTAKARGESTYLGQPCSKGHEGLRYTANRVCAACHAERNAAVPYDREKGAAWKRAWRAKKAAAALGADLLDTL